MTGEVNPDERRWPLVSIGVPTYNRAARLQRAIESVLAQDYPHLELIISDDASTDDTATVCEAFAQRDARVRYLRQWRNRGVYANFQEVFRQSHGEYFMWLSDDDWIDRTYVTQCLSVLRRDDAMALVCGAETYALHSGDMFHAPPMNLLCDAGWKRVLRYYSRVWTNGALYSLMHRDRVATAPLRDAFGADWVFVSAMAYQGKIRTVETVAVHRSFGGVSGIQSVSGSRLWRVLHEGTAYARNAVALLSIAVRAWQEIIWRGPVYRTLGWPARVALGSSAFTVLYAVNATTILKGVGAFLAREIWGERDAPLSTRYGR